MKRSKERERQRVKKQVIGRKFVKSEKFHPPYSERGLHPSSFSRERFRGENSTFATISQLIPKPRTNLFVNGEIVSLYYTSPLRDSLRFLSRENNIIEFLLKGDKSFKKFSYISKLPPRYSNFSDFSI